MTPPRRTTRLPLRGVTVVIDPGHGGADPGAFRGTTYESALSYRMAATFSLLCRRAGAKTIYTIRSAALRKRPQERGPEPALILPRDACPLAAPNHIAGSGRDDAKELYLRAATAARVWKARGPHVAFVSLHFDVDPSESLYGGFPIYDIRDKTCPRLAQRIMQHFVAHGLAGNRNPGPIPRDLGVLNPAHNPIPQKVLVELATITSAHDRKRVHNRAWRWHACRVLVQCLIECRREKRL